MANWTCFIGHHYGPNKRGIYTLMLNKRNIQIINTWASDAGLTQKASKAGLTQKANEAGLTQKASKASQTHIILYDNILKINWQDIGTQCRLINNVPVALNLIYKHAFLKFVNEHIGFKFFKKYPYGFEIKTNKKYIKHNINKFAKLKLNTFGTDLWIVKPYLQASGRGIELLMTNDLLELKDEKYNKYIAQKYIEKPLLFNGHKFDMRMYILMSQDCKLYFYNQMEVRVSSKKYNINDLDKLIHLTNVAIQVKDNKQNYKYAMHNDDFFPLYEKEHQNNLNYKSQNQIVKESMKIILEIFDNMDMSYCSKQDIFYQLFGIDIILDENYNVYIIEINNNPGVVVESSLPKLTQMFHELIDDTFKLTIDKIMKVKSVNNNFILLKNYKL